MVAKSVIGCGVMDELDRKIIDQLKLDGRQSAQAIAEAVGASAVTVRMRIKALEQSGMLRVVAVTDFAAAGFNVLLAVGVEVERRNPLDVGRDLAQFDSVLAVNMTTGANDIEMLVGAADFHSVSRFLEDELGSVPGVGRLTTAVALDVYKYRSEDTSI